MYASDTLDNKDRPPSKLQIHSIWGEMSPIEPGISECIEKPLIIYHLYQAISI